MLILMMNSKLYEPCLNHGESPLTKLKCGVNILYVKDLFIGSCLDTLVNRSDWCVSVGEMRMGNLVQEVNGMLMVLC